MLTECQAGPVAKPERKREPILPPNPTDDASEESSAEVEDDNVSDEDATPVHETQADKPKKRKRKDEDDNLEGAYFEKLEKEEEKEAKKKDEEEAQKAKKQKKKERKDKKEKKAKEDKDAVTTEEGESSEKAEKTKEDGGASDSDWSDSDSEVDTSKPIIHESLLAKADNKPSTPAEIEVEKSQRTIFIGNLPSTVISNKSEYHILRSTFRACGPIESIRFRSIAFAAQIPRKAAYLTHKLHETQNTLNAYIVFKAKDAMRAALKLNGAVILERHMRVDSVAHPAEQDPKRCVFVGNLDFEAQEEILWRHFAQCGKVESVRLIRDAATNVGKGFAYVQFEDENAVEKALLLNDKKPTPKDRKLRVVRARKVKKRAEQPGPKPKHNSAATQRKNAKRQNRDKDAVFKPKADPAAASTLGRAKNLLGKAGAAQLKEQVKALEGVRASNTMPSGVKNAPKLRPLKKSAERALKWKKEKMEKVKAKVKDAKKDGKGEKKGEKISRVGKSAEKKVRSGKVEKRPVKK